MRLHVGPPPQDQAFKPEEGGWHRLKEPESPFLQLLLSLPVGALAVVVYMMVATVLST